jgi:hypothetical protein
MDELVFCPEAFERAVKRLSDRSPAQKHYGIDRFEQFFFVRYGKEIEADANPREKV